MGAAAEEQAEEQAAQLAAHGVQAGEQLSAASAAVLVFCEAELHMNDAVSGPSLLPVAPQIAV